ncbi:MAG: aromatic ring-hydroxylating dioxygenase subunit alpha [Leptolyngbyaceae cyanobacterium MO_188.B28]|nr:aromatic ring-hydroxylating dioxygenase subunit alpha [Leptolyngbyaceae cyanobacterium MO_188.B28]
MALKNFWYVADLSSAIINKPKRINLLGRDFVLYRNTKGQVAALSNWCVHRGGSLSHGWVEDDCLRCPYHGWKYRADGVCIEIPANRAGAPIAKRARVKTYPVQEKYGWIWLFLGDLPTAERPPHPPLPEFDKPDWRVIYGEFLWDAPYTRVVENAIDIAHTPFVHATSFGNRDEPQVENYDMHLAAWSGSASVMLKPRRSKGLWRYIHRKDSPGVKTTATFFMPNVTRLEVDLGNGAQMIIFGSHKPIDDYTTLTQWIQLRNFFTHPWFDGDAKRRTLKIFREDQKVVETLNPNRALHPLATEFHVRSDALAIAYRKLNQQCLNRGWGINQPLNNSVDSSRRTISMPNSDQSKASELTKV